MGLWKIKVWHKLRLRILCCQGFMDRGRSNNTNNQLFRAQNIVDPAGHQAGGYCLFALYLQHRKLNHY